MLMTANAMRDTGPNGTSLASHIGRAVARFFGFGISPRQRPLASSVPLTAVTVVDPLSDIVPTTDLPPANDAQSADLKWRKHPLLRRAATDGSKQCRDARCEVVRALFAARAGALDSALDHFTKAAAEPTVDLTAVPGFWQLERRAMFTAVTAYESVGRIRDAAALSARIRTTMRPRALASAPTNVIAIPAPETEKSGTR